MAAKELRAQLKRDYHKALKPSPRWVRVAFQLYVRMPDKVVLNKPFLYFLLGFGKGTSPFKMSQKMSDYGKPKVEGQNCGNCRFAYKKVVEDKYICSQIRGEIKPELWCRLYKSPKASGVDGNDYMDEETTMQEWDIEFSEARGQSDTWERFYETAAKNEVVFRNVLRNLRIDRDKLPMGVYIPKDFDTELPLPQLLKKYSAGDRDGIFTISDFEMPDNSTAIIGFEDMATLSGGGAVLEYTVNKDGTVKYAKQLSVSMS